MFIIVSGRPAGEVYHRAVFTASEEYDAQECRITMARAVARLPEHLQESWVYGPSIFTSDDIAHDARALTWDGHEEVQAPQYVKPYPRIVLG